jgi:hypothetical protein
VAARRAPHEPFIAGPVPAFQAPGDEFILLIYKRFSFRQEGWRSGFRMAASQAVRFSEPVLAGVGKRLAGRRPARTREGLWCCVTPFHPARWGDMPATRDWAIPDKGRQDLPSAPCLLRRYLRSLRSKVASSSLRNGCHTLINPRGKVSREMPSFRRQFRQNAAVTAPFSAAPPLPDRSARRKTPISQRPRANDSQIEFTSAFSKWIIGAQCSATASSGA